MGIAIKGIRINKLDIVRKDDKDEVTGSYSLMSNLDKVLASDNFNGYSDIKVNFSPKTLLALQTFLTGVKEDLSITVLGAMEEGA